MTEAEGRVNQAQAETIGTLAQFRDLYGGMHLHLPEQRKERVLPRMLGPRNVHYTDREEQLALLDAARERATVRGVPLVVLCVGPDGIGKSELVTEWLGRLAETVPGPHLYADMSETGPVTAKEVLGRFLRLMGEPPEDLPDDQAELAGLFRTRTHGVASIVFLDNVVLASQARPLLPETAGSVMVITSRGLDGTLRGAVPVPLGRMADEAVIGIVEQVAGIPITDPARSRSLAAVLDGSPLRAFTAGMQLALGQPLEDLIQELDGPGPLPDEERGSPETDGERGRLEEARERGRLGEERDRPEVDGSGPEPDEERGSPEAARGRGCLGEEWDRPEEATGRGRLGEERDRLEEEMDLTDLLDSGYRKLSPEAARLYRALAGLLRRKFTAEMAAAVADVADVGSALAELVAAGLVRAGEHGYLLDTATRRHLSGLVTDPEREESLRRVVGWYLEASVRADYSALPKRWWLGEHYDPYRGTVPPLTESDAMAWLEDELDAVLAAVRAASERGWHRQVVRLVEAQWAVCLKRKPYDHWRACYELGVRSAEELWREGRDERFLGRMRCGLGFAHLGSGRIDEAVREFTAARAAEAAIGHVRGLATAVEPLGLAQLARSGAETLPELETRDEQAAREALAALEENLSINRSLPVELADRRAIALAERHLGRALSAAGEHERALAHFQRARGEFAELPDRYNLGKTLIDLAQATIRANLLTEAAPALREALELLRADESPAEVVRALETISVLTERSGDRPGAAHWLTLALENLQAREHPRANELISRIAALSQE